MSPIVSFLYLWTLIRSYKSFYIDKNGNQHGLDRWEIKDAISSEDEEWKMTSLPIKETNAFILKYCSTAKPWTPPIVEE